MKARTLFFSFIILSLITGCSITDSPKTVVKKFYKAIENNDTKALAQVATPETVQVITMFGTKLQGMILANGKIKTLSEEIHGNTAVVTVIFENDNETNLDLIKVGEKWRVNFSIDDK